MTATAAYPDEFVTRIELQGHPVLLRPIRAEDASIEQAFVRGLSPLARHFRFLDTLIELTPNELKRLTDIDYLNMMALIAVVEENGVEREIGVARYAVDDETPHVCEFAVVVADAWCGSGLAAALMQQLIAIARQRGLTLMYGDILHNNCRMLHFVRKLGFRIEPHPDEGTLRRAILDL